MNLDDTIVAIATPPGRGGIGVVRLAGPESKSIASQILRLSAKRTLDPNRAEFCELIDIETAERIDEVVATLFAAPHSYTTDDIVEISCHGSPVVLRRVVEMATAQGARLAEPGEFTQRAFLNGRLDLTQAEAVRDLIDSQTLYQAKVAAQQLKGSLSRVVLPIKEKLIALIARLEAGIDFAEDDISVMPTDQILAALEDVKAPLRVLASSFTFGKVVHQGLTLAIVGRPNVGKSSLFNQLVERERAIVTALPGTTRDLVTETVALGGIPVRLIDTAGIREALDEAEHIGIRKSMEALADADIVLVVLDTSNNSSEVDRELLTDVSARAAIVVHNKSDLSRHADSSPFANLPTVRTSALTGEGIPELRAAILQIVRGNAADAGGAMLTNLRQQTQVQSALTAIAAAENSLHNSIPHEMVLLDLYSALRALDEMTGATTSDDILNLIFSTFCIGK
ncbi:MAG TPA: tRNA uridine-5-carboxymethylaminomethyl(34) synthesis GTPase MnmE [Candidatus Saccharimonadales bacterium]|nr:tRNA uridine-5-carboxymethylaminomethyl(34) synthesis GTPase MnmE [Candidatus Saccharimonadales bacterium]